MESKLTKHLYFAGEVLDLDAFTGGFNLQIAWSTGYTAGTYKLFDYTGEDATAVIDYKSLLSGSWNNNYMVVNNDLYITDQNNSVIYVNSAYTEYECDGYIYGYNAFSDMNSAIASLTPEYVLGDSFDNTENYRYDRRNFHRG